MPINRPKLIRLGEKMNQAYEQWSDGPEPGSRADRAALDLLSGAIFDYRRELLNPTETLADRIRDALEGDVDLPDGMDELLSDAADELERLKAKLGSMSDQIDQEIKGDIGARIQKIRLEIREAGDRRDWDECDRLEALLEQLKRESGE